MKRGVVFIVSISLVLGLIIWRSMPLLHRFNSLIGDVTWIIQTGPDKRALKTDYLAELLGLSLESHHLDLKQATSLLLKSPVIIKGSVKRIDQKSIMIDYTVRKPYVWLADFDNLALDRNGIPFPVLPFYTPKKMPELIVRQVDPCWHQPIEGKQIEFAFDILNFLEKQGLFFSTSRVDVSQMMHPSLGAREIVLIIENQNASHFLRLAPLDYRDGINRYLRLRKYLDLSKDVVVDLRLRHLAFLKVS